MLGSELLFTIFLCQLDQRHCLPVWVFVILWYSPKEASWQLMNQSCYNSANYKLLACSQSSVHHPISATMKRTSKMKGNLSQATSKKNNFFGDQTGYACALRQKRAISLRRGQMPYKLLPLSLCPSSLSHSLCQIFSLYICLWAFKYWWLLG